MTKPGVPRRTLPTSPFSPAPLPPRKQFAVGNRVTHDEHGLGTVTEVEGDTAVLVDFGEVQKRILNPYTKMTKL